MNLVNQFPWWMYVFCLSLGAIYAFVLYRKDRKLSEFHLWLVRGLSILRFVTVSVLAILLLAPLVKYISKRVEQPIVIIAQDNSASIVMTKDSAFYRNQFPKDLQNFKNGLNDKYQVDEFYFDESLYPADSAPIFEGKMTNIQALFNGIEERYVNRNVGAIVLLTDGIYNRGSNPIYQQKGVDFPIYTLALGDTTIHRDIQISKLLHNDIAYLGNQFPLAVDLNFYKAKGSQTELKVLKDGKEVYAKKLNIGEEKTLSISINLEAKTIGLQKYEVVLTPIKEEVNILNNRQAFYIDVLDGRQNVLLLYDAPHPDIAAINAAISKNKNYKLEVKNISDFKGDVSNYNLVINYQIPSNKAIYDKLQQLLKESKVALWYIVGGQTNFSLLNQLQLPIKINVSHPEFNEVYPLYNSAFPLFEMEENQLKLLASFPPLSVPFGKYLSNGQAYVLLNQKVGAVDTDYPLLAFAEKDGKKTAVWIGEGIWRWRLANYADVQNHTAVDDLISKVVQYLALKADKSFFRIKHNRQFMENEAISFELQLYNESYELVNDPEVEMQLQDEEGKTYNYSFSRSANSYYLEIPSLPIGNYNYKASTNYGNKNYEEVGQFSVEKIQLEAAQTVGNHNLLFQLAKKSGGKMYYPNELAQLEKELLNRKDITAISYNNEEVEDIINLPWIFYLLIFLLSLEWFLRKRNGAY